MIKLLAFEAIVTFAPANSETLSRSELMLFTTAPVATFDAVRAVIA